MKFFHGTKHKIEEFNLDFVGLGNDEAGGGIYFTNNKETALRYATNDGFLLTCSIDEKSSNLMPIDKTMKSLFIKKLIAQAPNHKEILENFGDIDYEGYKKVLNSAIDTYIQSNLSALNSIEADFYKNNTKLFLENVKNITGYDGFIRNIGEEQHLIVFNPKIITIIDNKLSKDIEDINKITPFSLQRRI